MFNIGGGEMVFLAILALLVFGPEGLPEIVKTVTRTVRAFRQAANDFQSEVNSALTIETQKREVAQRRRNRALPAEPKLETKAEEGEAPSIPPEDSQSEAVGGASDRSALPEESTNVPAEEVAQTEAALQDTAGESEPLPDDDDGPGIPMAKPVRIDPSKDSSQEDPSQENAAARQADPPASPATDPETVV